MNLESIKLCEACWERLNQLKALKEEYYSKTVEDTPTELSPNELIEEYMDQGMPYVVEIEECCGKTRTLDTLIVFWLYF